MNNAEKRRILGNNGTKVHVYSLWDSIKGKLLTTVVVSFVIAYCNSNLAIIFYLFLPIYFVVTLGKLILMNMNIIPYLEKGTSIVVTCPHCNAKASYLVPSLRMECPTCHKECGFFDGSVYKITKENEQCFETEHEKTNRLLEKKSKEDNKSNLQQLKELKELLDMDAITKEEYEEKKKELLK